MKPTVGATLLAAVCLMSQEQETSGFGTSCQLREGRVDSRFCSQSRFAERLSSRLSMSSNSMRQDDGRFSAFADAIDEEELFTNKDYNREYAAKSSWQESLEQLLDPSTPFAKRQILISDLLNSNENIRSDVQAALRDRKIDYLLTPTGKKIQDGTKAVARQITNDILPGLAASASSRRIPVPEDLPSLFPKIGSRIVDAFSNQAKKQVEMLRDDLADPSRIPLRFSNGVSELAKEARNVFAETPQGYIGPKYDIEFANDQYEIRNYKGYFVASTSMSKVGEPYSMDDVAKGGAAFNALAAYLFGANDQGKSMDMTTPVTTTSYGEMRFYLKQDNVVSTSNSFPNPLSPENGFNERGAVKIKYIPPARLAVARFTGFVTEGEVSRQKDALLSALAVDGVEVDVPHGAIVPHVVFQYNPPYTIPFLRRNEIAVPIQSPNDESSSDLESEWGNENIPNLSPSDVE